MEYNDEQILNNNEYELLAKAYSDFLLTKGFKIIKIDNEKNAQLINDILLDLSKIKYCLFRMGGFLGTSKLYSLTDRQIKKLTIIFDNELPLNKYNFSLDKMNYFLEYIGLESNLIKNLIILSEQSSFENELKQIIFSRLSYLQEIFNIKI